MDFVRNWFREASPRAMAVLMGISFGASQLIVQFATGGHGVAGLIGAGIGAAVGGAIFGAIMGPFSTRRRDAERAAAGFTGDDRWAAVDTAALPGRPVPADPEIRDGATRLVEHRLDDLVSRRGPVAALFGVIAALAVVAAWAWSPWSLLGVPMMLALTANMFWQTRRLERRLDELGSPETLSVPPA